MRSKSSFLLGGLLFLGACASTPEVRTPSAVPATDSVASKAADNALAMVGKPYRFGGSTPAGFDCSGLVQYSYHLVGVRLPRETRALRERARPIRARDLRRGDLLFFDEEGKKSSHVAIYLGDNHFVHAPSSGGRVRTDSLDVAHWRRHFVEARRI
jgi:cell wall-associated NlpC family hydrolase